MPRPCEFDPERALDASIGCFWKRGYEGTSMRDLADAMGIAGASLYNTFGGKRSLFQRALARYLDLSVRERIARLESTLPAREAIGAFLNEIVERSFADRQRRGCLLVNTAVETAPHDAVIRAAVVKELAAIEAFFRRCVEAGQRAGTITERRSATDLSRLLLGAVLAIRVLARVRPERDTLEGMARPVLALLNGAEADSKQRPGMEKAG
jgi:TetR/AcrR family transcriptional repressor of nem operon